MFNINNIIKTKTIDETVKVLCDNNNSMLLAGGTDVMIKLRDDKLEADTLISISEVDELKGICINDNGDIEIGPMTIFDDVYRNELINNNIDFLGYACNQVGSPQIRHIGTIGGNVCNGAVSADSVPSLYALDAKLVIRDKNGEEIIPIEKFHTGPGQTIILNKPALLTKIVIPLTSYEGYQGCYIKTGQRRAMEISSLGCAVNLKLNETKDKIEDIKMAFGVAAKTPIRVYNLEKDLKNKEINDDLFKYIEDNVLDELSPRQSWRASLALRQRIIKTISVRATKCAINKSKGEC